MVSLSLLLAAKSAYRGKGSADKVVVDTREGGVFKEDRGQESSPEAPGLGIGTSTGFGRPGSSSTQALSSTTFPFVSSSSFSSLSGASTCCKDLTLETFETAFGSKGAAEKELPRDVYNLLKTVEEQTVQGKCSSAYSVAYLSKNICTRRDDQEGDRSRHRQLIIDPIDLLEDLDAIMGDANQLKQLLSRAQPLSENAVGRCIGAIAKRLEIDAGQTESDLSSMLGVYEALASSILSGAQSSGTDTEADSKELPKYNPEVFVKVVMELYPDFHWDKVLRGIDYMELTLRGPQGFRVIAEAYSLATKKLLPADFLLRTWTNRACQLRLLSVAVALGGKSVAWEDALPMVTVDWDRQQPQEVEINAKMWSSVPMVQCLLDFYSEVGEPERAMIKNLFEVPVKSCAEILALSVASAPTKSQIFQQEVFSNVVKHGLISSPYHSAVIRKAWEINPALVTGALLSMWQKDDPSTLARIFDTLQELKSLDRFLKEIRNYSLALHLAILSSRREFLNLEKWVTERIADRGTPFVESCIAYLAEKTQSQRGNGFPIEATTVIFECLNSAIEKRTIAPELVNDLKALHKSYTSNNLARRSSMTSQHTQAEAIVPTAPETSMEPGGGPQFFDRQIDEEANSYFCQVYEGRITIDGAVELLLRFKMSQNPREHDIFNCMIHNLLDEYRFFPQYPERELQITGKLFGALVRHRVFVSMQTLQIALWCVCDALRKPPPDKLTYFGLRALEQFKERLPEWPPYSAQILQIQHLRQIAPDLISYIEDFLRSGENAPAVLTAVPAAVPAAARPVVATTDMTMVGRAPTPMSTEGLSPPVEMTTVLEPDESTRDKIHFIFNNLTAQNLDAKAKELGDIITEKHQEYLAKYIVERRAAIEPNFHESYVAILEKLTPSIPKLLPLVLVRSFDNVRILLASDKIRTSSTERGPLKNLGTWVGSLTLARNKPLLARDIDIKELIFEAYADGRLIAVIPFVCKILDSCAKSKVFRPPNPWVTAILGLLRELCMIPDLKMNIKFEIEVLCKKINVDLKEIKTTDVLRTKPQPRKLDHPDFTVKKQAPPPSSTPQAPEPVKQPAVDVSVQEHTHRSPPAVPTTAPQLTVPIESEQVEPPRPVLNGAPTPSIVPPAPAASVQSAPGTVIPNLAQRITINPSLTLFQTYPHLKRFLPMAIDQAVREIIQPVVERSCTIACITTRELILKDFALETDVNKIRQAAHQMVEYLAGALALVTCKDPLRVSMNHHLRSLLVQSGVDQNILEQTVNVVTAENLEVCCLIIERAGLQKATKDIDEILAPEFQQKRQSQMKGMGGPSEVFPPHSSGLSAQHMRVYDDFLRLNNAPPALSPPQASQTPPIVQRQPSPLPTIATGKLASKTEPQPQVTNGSVAAKFSPHSGATPGGAASAMAGGQPSQQLPSAEAQLSTQQVLERFNSIYPTLDAAIQSTVAANSDVVLSDLPMDHDVQKLWTQIPSWVRRSTTADEAGMAIAQKVFQGLFQGDSGLNREVHVAILELLRESCKRLPKELVSWLAYSDEKRKFHRECIIALLKPHNILNTTEYDVHLAKAIDNGRNAVALDFAAFLVHRGIIEEALATPAELFNTLEVLQKLGSRANPPLVPSAPEGLLTLVEQARKQAAARALGASGMTEEQTSTGRGYQELYASAFEEWIGVYTSSKGNMADRMNLATYVERTIMEGMDSEEAKERFFTVAIEVSTEIVGRYLAVRDGSEDPEMTRRAQMSSPYAAIDALAVLIAIMVDIDVKNGETTLHLAFGAIVNNLKQTASSQSQRGQQGGDLRQHFRLFSSLMVDIATSFGHASGNSGEDPRAVENLLPKLSTIKDALDAVKPHVVPSFAFSWLELISSKYFMPLLLTHKQKGWPLLEQLLVDMLSFLNPHLQAATLSESTRVLYKGTLRTLLVLLHDFPEFLCDYHFTLCDVIPPNCIQLRNLVLSAFPHCMRLPDPFTVDLKVDKLPEMSTPPNVLSDFTAALARNNLKANLDNHLKSRAPASMLLDLRSRLQLSAAEAATAGTKYNIPAINAVVFYVGQHAIGKMNAGQPINRAPHMDVFQHLTSDFDAEGRYHFINAIVNQLRYPNYHTHYFSCVLLYLFADAKQEIVQEQITRVLVERCLANRPHPWGLLLTFVELIKNPRYNFWSHSFVRCAPEIERLFESVAKSCMNAVHMGSPMDDMGIAAAAFG